MKRALIAVFMVLSFAAWAEDPKPVPLTEAQQNRVLKKQAALDDLQKQAKDLEIQASQMQAKFAAMQNQFNDLSRGSIPAAQKDLDDTEVAILAEHKLDKEKFQVDVKTLAIVAKAKPTAPPANAPAPTPESVVIPPPPPGPPGHPQTPVKKK